MSTRISRQDAAKPEKDRCYRCHRPFPQKKIMEVREQAPAVIRYEPEIFTARVWSIPNRPLPVPVCRRCAGVPGSAEGDFIRAMLVIGGAIHEARVADASAATSEITITICRACHHEVGAGINRQTDAETGTEMGVLCRCACHGQTSSEEASA